MLGIFCIGAIIGLIAGSILGKKNGYEKGYKACLEYEAEERTNLDKIEMATTKKDDTEVDVYEQKPVEWSEEEKKFIKHCAELLDRQGEPMCALRLESLRPQPHWKPSKEQMKALEDVKMRMSLDGHLLETLINDLKSL